MIPENAFKFDKTEAKTDDFMPRVSIVLIAYNDEEHVESAIRSLCAQTLADVEIICVNDGSTDATLEIMKRSAEIDHRMQIITQPNNGCFSARYTGLQKASGEYVMFVDSDDALLPEAAETLLREAEKKHADVLEFGVELIGDGSDSITNSQFHFLSGLFSPDRPLPAENNGAGLIEECFIKRNIPWNIWNKLYRTDLVRKAWQFYQGENITMSEDMLETLMILCFTRNYARIDTKLYRYHFGIGLSRPMETIFTEERIRIFGMEALVLRLQREWMEKLPEKPAGCEAGIDAFRKYIRCTLFDRLLYKCVPSKREEMVSWIRKCITPEEFSTELLAYTYDLAEKNDSLQQKLVMMQTTNRDLQKQYDAISNSFFWKITKPFRKFTDHIKRFRKISLVPKEKQSR